MIIPFLTPRFSSYWIDLVTRVKACLARPLIDSHKHEAIVKDHSIRNIIPIKLRSFEEEIKAAKGEQIPGKAKITKEIYLPFSR
jgi:hypothetical protein